MSSRLFVLAFLVLVGGCATDMGRANSGADLPSERHSYIVFGVEPEFTQVSMFAGKIKNGSFRQGWAPAVFAGQPEDGFFVTRARADKVLGVTYVVMFNKKFNVFNGLWVPCGDTKTPVIRVPAGKVIYVGSVEFEHVANGVLPTYNTDFEAAKAFLEKRYPGLAGNMEYAPFDLMPVSNGDGCRR